MKSDVSKKCKLSLYLLTLNGLLIKAILKMLSGGIPPRNPPNLLVR